MWIHGSFLAAPLRGPGLADLVFAAGVQGIHRPAGPGLPTRTAAEGSAAVGTPANAPRIGTPGRCRNGRARRSDPGWHVRDRGSRDRPAAISLAHTSRFDGRQVGGRESPRRVVPLCLLLLAQRRPRRKLLGPRPRAHATSAAFLQASDRRSGLPGLAVGDRGCCDAA
jgi:hypothetical protein